MSVETVRAAIAAKTVEINELKQEIRVLEDELADLLADPLNMSTELVTLLTEHESIVHGWNDRSNPSNEMLYFKRDKGQNGIAASQLGDTQTESTYQYYQIHEDTIFTWHGGTSVGPNIPGTAKLNVKKRDGSYAIILHSAATWLHTDPTTGGDILEFRILEGYDFTLSGNR